mgnify:CR=1 FL=1
MLKKSHYDILFCLHSLLSIYTRRSPLSLSHSFMQVWHYETGLLISNRLPSCKHSWRSHLFTMYVHSYHLPHFSFFKAHNNFVPILFLVGKSIWMNQHSSISFLSITSTTPLAFTHISMASSICINLGTKVQFAQFYWICYQYGILWNIVG